MRTRAISILILTSVLLVCGCETVEPRYLSARVVSDPGFIGTWEEVKSKDFKESGTRFEITARRAKVANGRFIGGNLKPSDDDPHNASSVEAYIAHLADEFVNISHPDKTDDAKPAVSKPEPLELWVVLLSAGESHRLAGVQVRQSAAVQWGVPWHMLLRFKRDGDMLTVQAAKHPIVWMSNVQPLDPLPEGDKPIPTQAQFESRADGGLFVTFDPDRLLQVYAHYVDDDSFWGNATTLHRTNAAQTR